MMKSRIQIACGLVAIAMSTTVIAQGRGGDLNSPYSYLEAGVVEMDTGATMDGFRAEASLALGDFLFAEYHRQEVTDDEGLVDLNFDIEGYGIGFRAGSIFATYAQDTWDVLGLESEVEVVRAGIRHMWNNGFELSASYTLNEFETGEEENGYQIGLSYRVIDNVDIVVDFETLDGLDYETMMVGLRLSF